MNSLDERFGYRDALRKLKAASPEAVTELREMLDDEGGVPAVTTPPDPSLEAKADA